MFLELMLYLLVLYQQIQAVYCVFESVSNRTVVIKLSMVYAYDIDIKSSHDMFC